MSKYEVKVGKPLEGEVTIQVVSASSFSWKKVVMYVAISMVLTVFLSSVAYGMATGDYSALKGIAESGKTAIDLAIQIARKKFQ